MGRLRGVKKVLAAKKVLKNFRTILRGGQKSFDAPTERFSSPPTKVFMNVPLALMLVDVLKILGSVGNITHTTVIHRL